MGSAGWGAYRDQLNRAEKSWINFFPVEFALQVGSEGIERHYFEIGVGSVVAFGKQEFVYERASGGGPWYERSIVKNTAIQFFPRLGYSFFGYNGFMLRFAFTPHLYPGSYDNHENAFLVKHAVWISMGASFGWTL